MYYVLGKHTWNKRIFEEYISKLPGEWKYIDDPKELTLENLEKDNPSCLFFMHWSDIVPKEITDHYECIVFHPTNVPFGRGGSPIQNLLLLNFETTTLSAIRMTEELDAGPVYLRWNLPLYGTAEEIYCRLSQTIAYMIEFILKNDPTPTEQFGDSFMFKRRTPTMSEIDGEGNLEGLHTFIRMLDAETYPHAFLNYGNFRLELTHSNMYDNRIDAHVTITQIS